MMGLVVGYCGVFVQHSAATMEYLARKFSSNKEVNFSLSKSAQELNDTHQEQKISWDPSPRLANIKVWCNNSVRSETIPQSNELCESSSI